MTSWQMEWQERTKKMIYYMKGNLFSIYCPCMALVSWISWHLPRIHKASWSFAFTIYCRYYSELLFSTTRSVARSCLLPVPKKEGSNTWNLEKQELDNSQHFSQAKRIWQYWPFRKINWSHSKVKMWWLQLCWVVFN